LQKKNGILESPTGTGKTLCLLCSSIAWLIRAKADLQFSAFKNDVDDGNANLTKLYKAGVTTAEPVNSDHGIYPKIIYASRTHSQLTQVVKELKMSSYNEIKTCVIGSRDQLCINPQVNSQKNYTVKMNMCKAKVTAKTCYFHNNMEANAQELKTLNTVDIEDLVKLGAKLKICPYYSVRQLKDTADILFMPYNYLLDKKLRKSNQIELKNTVVIFDEAHNVERICEDSASTEITSTDLASAMDEIGFILDDIKYSLENDVQLSFGKDNNHDGPRGADNNDNQDLMNAKNIPATLEELGQIKMLLKELETRLDQIHIDEKLGGCTKPAVFIYELLADCGVHLNNKDIVFEILQRLLQYFGAQTTNSRHNNGASLGKFYDFVQIVFSDKSVSSANVEMDKPNSRKPTTPNVYKVHIKYDTTKARVLCYWCFSASQVMKELLDEGVRSIILTSGTLSPIGSLKTELRVPFDIVLENPHIIKGEQIKVLAINRGPKNVVLRSNYDNRLNDAYIDGLGNLIISLIRIIPSGVLVFFPSYYVCE
jgi:regulator of telomere elongation helicase 1